MELKHIGATLTDMEAAPSSAKPPKEYEAFRTLLRQVVKPQPKPLAPASGGKG